MRFRSLTTPPLARTRSFGVIGNTSFHVPAAAHTSSYLNKSGSMKIRSGREKPKGGTPPLVCETYLWWSLSLSTTGSPHEMSSPVSPIFRWLRPRNRHRIPRTGHEC